MLGMKTTITRASVIGAIANAMYGRRRPKGVLVASESGPTNSGRTIAKIPSAASTMPTSTAELVNSSRIGGMYAATVVIDQASPNAPRLSTQIRRAFSRSTDLGPAATLRAATVAWPGDSDIGASLEADFACPPCSGAVGLPVTISSSAIRTNERGPSCGDG